MVGSDAEVIRVPIEDVLPNDWNPNKMNKTLYRALVADIKKFGFKGYISARTHPTIEKKYQIIDGEQRYTALKELGFDEIPISLEQVDDETAKIITIRRNREKGDFDPQLLSDVLKDLNKKLTISQLAQELGYSEVELRGILKLSKQIKNLQDKAEEIEEITPVTFMLRAEELAIIEKAISKSEKKVREEALVEVCEYFLKK